MRKITVMKQRINSLVVKVLDSYSIGPGFKTTAKLQDQLSFSSFSEVDQFSTRISWELNGKK